MAAEGIPVELACRVVNVSTSGYYEWLTRSVSARSVRHAWLTGLVTEIHLQSRATYGARRGTPSFALVAASWSVTARWNCSCAAPASPGRWAGRSGAGPNNRNPTAGMIVHSDQGVQLASWAFTRRARDSGLVPSMGSVGDCYDTSMMESFWSRMQVELLDRRRWRTRMELANAIFDYLEIWHNRRRRHSSIGMLSPIEYERVSTVA
jgi:hypothetical protein